MKIAIAESLVPILRLGVLRLEDMAFTDPGSEQIWNALQSSSDALREAFTGLTIGQVPGIGDTRKLYRAVGLDPTKLRPSSEALMRRVLRGKELFRIHPLVDLFNHMSLVSRLPVGLYDESKIVGEKVTIRLGEEGWGFPGIRKDRVNVSGRLCVTDEKGPFGSPTSDSLRTSIEGDVKRALVIFFQHIDGNPALLHEILENAQERSKSALSANSVDSTVIG